MSGPGKLCQNVQSSDRWSIRNPEQSFLPQRAPSVFDAKPDHQRVGRYLERSILWGTITAPAQDRKEPTHVLDQLRHKMQTRLDELLSEAEKLRHALAALSSRDGATAAKTNGTSSPSRPRRRGRPAAASPTASAKPARSRPSATSPSRATAPASPKPARPPNRTAMKAASVAPARTAPGTTKTAVIAALGSGSAMTAGEVANATGLGRASVSTTLSKLAKTGQVTKADRGYQITVQISPDAAAATAGTSDEQPAT